MVIDTHQYYKEYKWYTNSTIQAFATHNTIFMLRTFGLLLSQAPSPPYGIYRSSFQICTSNPITSLHVFNILAGEERLAGSTATINDRKGKV